ncbi:uncharacterized protein C8Q71DRAFT_884337 [Rhodofomes roseus]|uniref:YEATS domain-containing protein n=1 Tax=Rhodofomes roseus TaxID=34475 RepID=A0ABQ8KSF5_9APHY|nr:uncharacterized protein C8Q71DRAFT_884337 [Rhodofomes roseus]KAH9841474.1 hypothetical protein C8Q71DRAFT_884337 [Rhodofomes roseus]
MNDSRDDHRPQKRRRVAEVHSGVAVPTPQQIVLEELDVELGLRERLYETVNSRLTWALLLQEALEKEYPVVARNADSSEFRAAALDALKAAEEPSKPLFDRELFPIDGRPPRPPATSSIDAPPPQYPSRSNASRARGLPRAPPHPAKKLLFLRNTNTDPPEIAKLACLDCGRSDFSNLQGLLNHCRLRHGREFGSHDECVQSCAVIVPEKERDWVVANGMELAGISLPSLRRLFEIAVGAGDKVRIPGPRKEPEQPSVAEDKTDTEKTVQMRETITEVTKTLGFHKDTPALAPFLGREPKKRLINVYEDPDEVLDILDESGVPANSLVARKGWRKPYSHRNIARAELDEIPPEQPAEPPDDHDERSQDQTPVANGTSAMGIASSRFHIVARVKVADSSLWIPPERRRDDRPEHTHRWRLVVSSPSYSLHITTFLEKLTVTCLSDPPPSTLINPIVVSEPPFAITSTTDRPFLARFTLTWTGSVNAPMDVEHWVDVDPMHLGHPVLGDEQVFDVELDRNTQLMPVRQDVRKLTWKDEDVGDTTDRGKFEGGRKIDENADSDEQGYGAVLRTLLQEVPITVRDARSRKQWAPTSALVPTIAQYRNLTPGRRKAIELSRARALLAAYREHAGSTDHPESENPLTVADVYHWMEDEGLFPRVAIASDIMYLKDDSRPEKTTNPHQVPEAYCRFCGLHQAFHPLGVKTEDDATKDVKSPYTTGVCIEFNAPPSDLLLLDVEKLLQSTSGGALGVPYGLSAKLWTNLDKDATPERNPSSADLVAVAHPGLLTSIRELAAQWHLPRLQVSIRPSLTAEDGLVSLAPMDRPHQELLDELAPYAVLSVVAGCMVRLLVRGGLDALRRDDSAQQNLARQDRTRKKGGKAERGGARYLLTPSHIARGLTDLAGRGLTESAALVCLARLGTATKERRGMVVTGSGVAVKPPDEAAVRIKEETEDM